MIIGTVVDVAAIVVGASIGLALAKVSKKVESDDNISDNSSSKADAVLKAIGLAVVIMGILMVFAEHDYFPVVASLALGTFIGEICKIESWVAKFGKWIKRKINSSSDMFVDAFVSTSILYCVGAASVLGAIQDGLNNDPALLYVKGLMDGVTAIIFASTMGVGVVFSSISVFLYQGAISLFASQLTFLTTQPEYMNGISVTGGVLLVGIGLNLLQVTKLRVGNMLPALVLIVAYDAIYLNFFV